MPCGALQIVRDRIVILETQLVFDHLGHDLGDTAKLFVPESISSAGIGQKSTILVGRAFADDHNTIFVVPNAFFNAF